MIHFNLFAIERKSWDSYNNPFLFPDVQTTSFELLPKSGATTWVPWAGYHWPGQKGGIALRWKEGKRAPFNQLKSYEQIQLLSENEIDRLSPAEKLDLLFGDYNYSVTKWVLKNNPYNSVKWAGICEGTALASMHLNQPEKIRMRNQYNQIIPLNVSDLKAYASWYMARMNKERLYFIGLRCNKRFNDPCTDVNPGAFHVVLGNLIGLKKKTFLMDDTKGAAVWNYPIYSYKSKVLKRSWINNGIERLQIETKVVFGGSVLPHDNKIDSKRFMRQRIFQYNLDLDYQGNIIGGNWLSQRHPDFLWYRPFSGFKGKYSFLNDLY